MNFEWTIYIRLAVLALGLTACSSYVNRTGFVVGVGIQPKRLGTDTVAANYKIFFSILQRRRWKSRVLAIGFKTRYSSRTISLDFMSEILTTRNDGFATVPSATQRRRRRHFGQQHNLKFDQQTQTISYQGVRAYHGSNSGRGMGLNSMTLCTKRWSIYNRTVGTSLTTPLHTIDF